MDVTEILETLIGECLSTSTTQCIPSDILQFKYPEVMRADD